MKVFDLGSSCLYIGGGGNQAVPGGPTPAGASSYLDINPAVAGELDASNGTGKFCHGGSNNGMSCTTSSDCGSGICAGLDCTKGSGPAKECVNAGTCVGGSNPGVNCFTATDCLGGGACTGPNPHVSCASDANCAAVSDSCQPLANCVFGPPLAIPNPAVGNLASCNINAVASDASGTGNPTTGDATVDVPLQTRIYITGNNGSPCPKCVCTRLCSGGSNAGMPCTTATQCPGGTCPVVTPPCNGTCSYGPLAGGACFTSSTTGNPATANTSHDCPPEDGNGLFNGALTISLNPLTTGTSSKTAANALFCPGQTTSGAFGQPRCQGGICIGATNCVGGTNDGVACTTDLDCPGGTCPQGASCTVDANCNGGTCTNGTHCISNASCPGGTCPVVECITETGIAAGNLTDGAPHAAREGVVFCIPATANGTVNTVVDLPGPGATSLPGIAQIVPRP